VPYQVVKCGIAGLAGSQAIQSSVFVNTTPRPPEVDPEDLRKYNDAALRLAHDLAPGEWVRWADLVNTAASMAEIEDQDQQRL